MIFTIDAPGFAPLDIDTEKPLTSRDYILIRKVIELHGWYLTLYPDKIPKYILDSMDNIKTYYPELLLWDLKLSNKYLT